MQKYKENENKLSLIPKTEKYIEYILSVIFKLPRTEKFSIGTEYKTSMYKMLNQIMYVNKIKNEDVKNKARTKVRTGRILHLDGDKKYSEKSYQYYRRLKLDAIVKNIPAVINSPIKYCDQIKSFPT